MTARQLDIGLIACSRTKADRPSLARELYVSPLFRAARAYAERRHGPGQWLILSARYGLVDPDKVLAPHCLTTWGVKDAFSRCSANRRTHHALHVQHTVFVGYAARSKASCLRP
jgi:hypothetical protein